MKYEKIDEKEDDEKENLFQTIQYVMLSII